MDNIKQTAVENRNCCSLDTVVNRGGPGGMQFHIECRKEGTHIKVWNPVRNEWATLTLDTLSDRKMER